MDIKLLKEKIIALNKSGRLQESEQSKDMIKRMDKVKVKIESAAPRVYKLPETDAHSFVRDSGI